MAYFVGKRFTKEQFKQYCLNCKSEGGWQPTGVCLHHTASPSLANRPSGLTEIHLKNLWNYYTVEKGWSGGPHLFVDDIEDGILVLQKLNEQGVHARSFNSSELGIEMLGDYDSSSEYSSDRKVKIFKNTNEVLNILSSVYGWNRNTFHFHRDDPKTNKTCPGSLVKKSEFIKDPIDVAINFSSMPTIKLGSSGKAVEIWQKVVGVKQDGDFGPKTHQATLVWQSSQKLKADGIVGPKTWSKAGL